MKKLKILLRFDDICPTMNWEQWDRAKQLMDEKGVTALLGVIPDCQDPDLNIDKPREDFWDYIKELQRHGFTIAMHGYHHVFDIQSSGIVTPKKQSEFAGHPYEIQYEKIKKGKTILKEHGIETDIFFAPAHSYDDNTLKALAANGFKYISDGMSSKPYKRSGIVCIPARSGGIPKIKDNGHYTAIMHAHEWVRTDKQNDWFLFQKVCDSYANKIVPFNKYAERPIGMFYLQRTNELLYVMFWLHIAPVLIKIKHYIMRIKYQK